MEQKILNLSFIQGTPAGVGCVEYNLQEMFYYYGYPFNAVMITGVSNVLKCYYYEIEDAPLDFRYSIVRKAGQGSLEAINSLPFKAGQRQYKNANEAKRHLIELIDNGIIVCTFLNTYYLNYTEDYLSLPGGLFGSGHACLVNGYDKKNKCFIISDPIFKVKNKRISFEEFACAWQYTVGTTDFSPLCALYIEPEPKEVDLNQILEEALVKNLKLYFKDGIDITDGISWKDVRGLGEFIENYQTCLEGNVFEESNIAYLKNGAYAILHDIRWSRYLYGHFLCLEQFNNLDSIEKYQAFFHKAYEQWTQQYNLLELGLETRNQKRVQTACNRIVEIVDSEICIIREMLSKYQ